MKFRQCMHIGCIAEATKQLCFVLYAHNHPPGVNPARGAVGLVVCDEHATDKTRLEAFEDNLDGQETLANGFREIGKAVPDFKRSYSEWLPIPDESEQFRSKFLPPSNTQH